MITERFPLDGIELNGIHIEAHEYSLTLTVKQSGLKSWTVSINGLTGKSYLALQEMIATRERFSFRGDGARLLLGNVRIKSVSATSATLIGTGPISGI